MDRQYKTTSWISTMLRCISAFVIIVIIFSGLAAPATADDEVTLRLDFVYYGGHVPFIAGIQKGIYKKHGLDVKALEGTGSVNTVQLIASGSDEFGFPDSGVLIKARAQGIPVKMIAGVMMKNPYVAIARQGEGFTDAKSLEKAKMAFSLTSSIELSFPIFAANAGIDKDMVMSNIKQANDFGVRNALFHSKVADTTFAYTTSVGGHSATCKCTLDVIKFSDYGVKIMANGIATSEAMIKNKPDVVARFAKATQESMQFSKDNPEEARDLWFQYVKETSRTRDVVLTEWTAAIDLLATSATAGKPLGCMALLDWQASVDQLDETGQLKSKPDAADLFSNEFLGNCN